MPCLSDKTIWELAEGEITGPAREDALQHLAECQQCQAILASERRLSRILRTFWEEIQDECPDEVEVHDYAFGQLPDARRTEIEEHLRLCALCKQTVELSRDFAAGLAREAARASVPPLDLGPTSPEHGRPGSFWGRLAQPVIAWHDWAAQTRLGMQGVVALAVALVLSASALTVAVRNAPPPVKTESVWVVREGGPGDPRPGVVQGAGADTETTFTWAMPGLNTACSFRYREGNRPKELVALGFGLPRLRPGGVIQVHDPSRSRNPDRALVTTEELVPDELMPYPRIPSSWIVSELHPIPGDSGDDLMVGAYDYGYSPKALIRFRFADGQLERLGTYFHRGALGFWPPQPMGGKLMTFFRGPRNVDLDTWAPGMPGGYLTVAGLIDLAKLTEPKVWQDRGGGGRLQGAELPVGIETTYVFFAPIPGVKSPFWGLPRYESDEKGGDTHATVEIDHRKYNLYADGTVEPHLMVDMPTAHAELKRLIPLFMGGLENQVVHVPVFEDDPQRELGEFVGKWYKSKYVPAVEEWAMLVEAEITAGNTTGDFVNEFRDDLKRIRAGRDEGTPDASSASESDGGGPT